MGSCENCFNDEFQMESILLTHDDPSLFVKSQWTCMGKCQYVTYRVTVALMFMVWISVDFVEEATKFYSHDWGIWFIFATNWSFVLLTISNIVHAATATYYYLKSKQYEDRPILEKMPGVLSFQWFLYSVAANSALVVSVSYWTFLLAMDTSDFLVTPMSRLKHTLNSVYVIFDLMIVATPIRIFHLIYPLFWGVMYSIFNAVYFINNMPGPNGHHYAYGAMDWSNPIESAVTCALGFMLATLNQCFLYEFYSLRVFIHSKVEPQEAAAKTDIVQAKEERINILQRQESNTDYHTVENIEMERVD